MAYADDTNVVGVDYAVPTPATDRPFCALQWSYLIW